jgi:RimJ/RimL family protein N-acetyltransferase
MILGTDRLTLRPLQSTDVETIASYSMRPELIRFLPLPPQTMESAARFVGQAVANGQPDPKGDWLFPPRSGKSQGSSALYASAFAQRNIGKTTSVMRCIQIIGKELRPGL